MKNFILLFKKSPLLAIAVFIFDCCNNNSDTNNHINIETPITPVINFSVSKSFAHDTSLFTEGFLFYEGKLFESTGSPSVHFKSLVVVDSLNTGKFETKIELDNTKYFGEGISFINNKLYQLTYKNKMCFRYDAKTFKLVDSFNYSNAEGWSLTTSKNELIMSDGTDVLTFINPENFTPVKTLSITENGNLLSDLNELEFIKGFIYANIWKTNYIVKIDTTNGNVVGKLDLSSLAVEAQNKNPGADVLNGIAYDSIADKIYVTGKLWPDIYEIKFPH